MIKNSWIMTEAEREDEVRISSLHQLMTAPPMQNVSEIGSGSRLLFTSVKLVLLLFFYFYCPGTGSFDFLV